MDNQNIKKMLMLYKHNRSKGSRKPVQVYEPLVWYTYEWLFIVKQGAKGVAMNSYTTEDSNISETYTCWFSECSNQHDTKQKWTSIRFQQVFMIFNSLVPDDAKWEPRTRSLLVQAKACSLMALNRHLDQRRYLTYPVVLTLCQSHRK